MALATTYCRASIGMNAPLITVETHLANGLPSFQIVGLPETTVKESKERVRSALMNAYFEFPQRRITINLAPADIPKQGGRYDLAIAIGILAASGQIPKESLHNIEFLAELSLSGQLRSVAACLPSALQSQQANHMMIISKDDAAHASLSQHQQLFSASHLLEVTAHLLQQENLSKSFFQQQNIFCYEKDFIQVKGQKIAKRAMCIAASGQHHILMAGPPGSGKSLLASCVPSILPPMQLSESIETACIHSLSRQKNKSIALNFFKRPFRAPHHSASAVALIGGGNPPQPGEISKAHNGVLFLDELPEFSRQAIESLREPLENGEVTISRAAYSAQFFAKFMLIATMNCCPCGYYLSEQACRCTPDQIQRYQNKLSGPLLDRIDLSIFVRPVSLVQIETKSDYKEMDSAFMQELVIRAHQAQLNRQGKYNSQLNNQELDEFCKLGNEEKNMLINIAERLSLSMRAYQRVIKVARTIADMEQSQMIKDKHIHEALSFRNNVNNKMQ